LIQSRQRAWLGYAMVLSGAALFAVNGVVAKVALASGLSSLRLTEVRITGAAVGLMTVLALTRPRILRVTRRELPFLAVFGIGGLAFVQWLYFLAIHRLEIGIALLIQYLAPLLVALWVRFVVHRPVRPRLWVALALSLTGLALVVQIWRGSDTGLDGLGVIAALGGAFAFAGDILLATVQPSGLSARNIIRGTMISLQQRDVVVVAKVDCGVEVVVHLTLAARDSLHLSSGSQVWLVVKTNSCHLMLR